MFIFVLLFRKEANFRYNFNKQCFYVVIRTQFEAKSKFYMDITDILKLNPIFAAIFDFSVSNDKMPSHQVLNRIHDRLGGRYWVWRNFDMHRSFLGEPFDE